MFLLRIEPVLEQIGTYEIVFCYDPSPDRTKEVLEEIVRNPRIRMLVFSRRFGQPNDRNHDGNVWRLRLYGV